MDHDLEFLMSSGREFQIAENACQKAHICLVILFIMKSVAADDQSNLGLGLF